MKKSRSHFLNHDKIQKVKKTNPSEHPAHVTKMAFARICIANKACFPLLKYASIGVDDTSIQGRKEESINEIQSKI